MTDNKRSGDERLLFVTPTYPDTTGNGLAMRASMFIKALSLRYRVSLLVVPVFGAPSETSQSFIQAHCEQSFFLEPKVRRSWLSSLAHRFNDLPELARLTREYATEAATGLRGQGRYDIVHAFRFYSLPLALELSRRLSREQPPTLHVDLDDVESSTRARLADLYRRNRRPEDAEREGEEALRYRRMESRLLPSPQRIYVCSQLDASRVLPTAKGRLRIVPNAVSLPREPIQPLTTHPFTFLFVGSLGYYPNEDAVIYFCREVLPMIRARTDRRCIIRIVGKGYSPAVRALARLKDVRVIGEVEDIGREYADADAVIVPVRAGGGVRIKVLEAFAYQRPVVSTTVGVEGIDAGIGQHCLVGDTPRTFAARCLYLMQHPNLRKRLADNAYELVRQRYTPEVVTDAILSAP